MGFRKHDFQQNHASFNFELNYFLDSSKNSIFVTNQPIRMLSQTEENYLKGIYKLSLNQKEGVSTNSIADKLDTKPASVSDMLKKLANKELINYIKYKGVTLSDSGYKEALKILRKHRLWEVFLVEKLDFNWDEVHEIAEQLEHIKSPLLTQRLDSYLGFPKFDPHGDPIPNEAGEITSQKKVLLSKLEIGDSGKVVGVQDSSSVFLKYLDKMNISLGMMISISDKLEFDNSLEIKIQNNRSIIISKEVAHNIYLAID